MRVPGPLVALASWYALRIGACQRQAVHGAGMRGQLGLAGRRHELGIIAIGGTGTVWLRSREPYSPAALPRRRSPGRSLARRYLKACNRLVDRETASYSSTSTTRRTPTVTGSL